MSSVEQNFRDAVDEYLRFCAEDGRAPEPASAVAFALAVPLELQQRVSEFAEEHHIQVNAVLEQALTHFLEQAK